jgi:exopolyphosphatase/guanosine-5'-triphosphate,3'-diphosphate pyrophosphatase
MPVTPELGDQFAAVDLGSNSFHMVVAQHGERGRLNVVDRIKVPVRLAAGLRPNGGLDEKAKERALECLRAFGERLVDFPAHRVRAVGTNTLRKANDAVQFLPEAEEALGHTIDIISGREEARMIYRGVVRDVEAPGRLLVLDIGGGSTELIVGEEADPTLLDSLFMGCVSWSQRFFPDGVVTAERMDEAVLAARQQLHGVVRAYRKAGWGQAVGSSGTINAIERILLAKGREGIDTEGIVWLSRKLIKTGRLKDLNLEGLSSDRQPVIAGGVAILMALFQGLRLKKLRATTNALREGVLLELVGREYHRDIRDDTVKRLMSRFEVDARQAFRVQHTAHMLFDQVQAPLNLKQITRQRLRWAANLHEVGMFLTYSGYHKHGAYLLTHLEMPGFSRQEQRQVATLVLGHRGNLSHAKLDGVALIVDRQTLHALALLRLAARIHRRRSPRTPPEVRLDAQGSELSIQFPKDWLAERPLTNIDLQQDAAKLAEIGYTLKVSTY